MARLMVSHNGPHSADDWAMATAEEIFQLEPSMTAGRMLEAKRFQLGIATLLSPMFGLVMEGERTNLSVNPDHCNLPHDVEDLAITAVSRIGDAGKGSSWAERLGSDEWKLNAMTAIRQHMMTAQHVERLWHADKNPENEAATAYKAKFHG